MNRRKVAHHGLRFVIDTEDWGEHWMAGDKAGGYLQHWLGSLGLVDTQRLHQALLSGDESELWNVSAVTMAAKSRTRAMSEDGWAELPDDGHTCVLGAEA